VIEDCAHAIETRIDGRPAGSFGALASFSFYATKNLTTAEGGMVLARDPALLARVRMLSLHGQSSDAWRRYSAAGFRRYDVEAPGWKYNLTDIASSMGRVQLRAIEARLARRREICARYDVGLAGLPLTVPPPAAPGQRLAHHLYTPMLDAAAAGITRDRLLTAVQAENIGVGIHYEAIHTLSYYRERLGLRPEDLPNAAWIGEHTISLPLSTVMSDADVDSVVTALRRIFAWNWA
jgi:dTDP-4-amino-4,6-dideoxygalactose transaminase